MAFLTAAEAADLDALVAGIEGRTGTQIVPAIVGQADSYAELPWTAFALGASLGAFGLVLADFWRPHWVTSDTAILHVTIVLGIAGACALLAIFAPPFARLFLRTHRADVEVRQAAESLFLRHALFRTRDRTAVLILVSLFERRIEILADTGLDGRVTGAEWKAIVSGMAPRMRERRPFDALKDALAAIEGLLASKGFQPRADGTDELPNRPIEELSE